MNLYSDDNNLERRSNPQASSEPSEQERRDQLDLIKIIQENEDKGINIIDILAGDAKPDAAQEEIFQEKLKNLSGTDEFFSDLLFTITYQRFDTAKAREIWRDILKHKYYLGEKLGRNVGVRVAALDYLSNHMKLLKNVRLLSEDTMDRISVFVNVDSLTGMYTHRFFQEKLREELMVARREKEELALFVIDVDNFKNYNDTFGHLFGDVILRQIAFAIKNNVRETDIVSRYGGDEFTVILPDSSPEMAMIIADRIRGDIDRKRFLHEDHEANIIITVSIGLAIFPEDADNPETLFNAADKAMYRAKKKGKNQIALATKRKQ